MKYQTTLKRDSEDIEVSLDEECNKENLDGDAVEIWNIEDQ